MNKNFISIYDWSSVLNVSGLDLTTREEYYLRLKALQIYQKLGLSHPVHLTITKAAGFDGVLGKLEIQVGERVNKWHQVGGNIYQLMKRMITDIDHKMLPGNQPLVA